jgi:TolB-like protein/class 3 adenylate cyclase
MGPIRGHFTRVDVAPVGGFVGMKEQRRLAAIVSADVVGYSRLMGADESGTLAKLKAIRREVVDPKIGAHGGRIVKTSGDGLLLEFPSVVDAVRCVVAVQTAMAAHNGDVSEGRGIVFRVGVNLGDIIIEGDDIFGDGVNVAARLQEIAAPGGICVSSRVHDDVRDRLDAVFTDGGEPQLKNIARPVRIWRWSPAGSPAPSLTVVLDTPPPLPETPSIAVLPFTNMSGDPEQAYFADGISEDIITALSRFPSLFVISRNSSFAYKGQAVDIRRIGHELGVRYVLEGSVRKGSGRIRVTGQLIDTGTGNHLWAEQYDGELGDIFALQDRITEAVAGTIAPTIRSAEIERARRKPLHSLDAYDLHLRGLSLHLEMTRDSNARALDLFEQAIRADPAFAAPVRSAAVCWFMQSDYGWAPSAEAMAQALDYAQRALRLEPDNGDTLAFAAHVTARSRGDGLTRVSVDEAVAMVSRGVALNPNSAFALRLSGWVHMYGVQSETAILHLERARRLSPKDLYAWYTWSALARVFLQLGRDQDAIVAAQTALQYAPNAVAACVPLTGALALAGRLGEARNAATRLLELRPSFRLSEYRTVSENISPAASVRLLEGLRLAGLPE